MLFKRIQKENYTIVEGYHYNKVAVFKETDANLEEECIESLCKEDGKYQLLNGSQWKFILNVVKSMFKNNELNKEVMSYTFEFITEEINEKEIDIKGLAVYYAGNLWLQVDIDILLNLEFSDIIKDEFCNADYSKELEFKAMDKKFNCPKIKDKSDSYVCLLMDTGRESWMY